MAIQERALHTRKVILEAAAELFNELGYEATTIAALIDRLPVTRGGVYFHFTSKASLAEGVLAEAVTTEGVVEQQFKLQEWADLGLLLAHRMPAEPMLRASIRLAVDPNARRLFGTRWPDWIRLGEGLLTEAKERGNCCRTSCRPRPRGCWWAPGPAFSSSPSPCRVEVCPRRCRTSTL